MGVWWITTVVIIRPSQPSFAGVGAGAELGNIFYCFISCFRLFRSIQSNKRKPVKRGWAPIPPADTYLP